MNSLERFRQLSELLHRQLLPLIDNDYVLYGLPYYANIGDTLIWEGTLELLKHSRYKCKGVCGWNDYPHHKLPTNQIILISGGGYFGDMWRKAWENVLGELALHRDNKIILLPNSICYNNPSVLNADKQLMSNFKNLIICVRDAQSYDFAMKYFGMHDIRLLPDLAFCVNPDYLKQWKKRTSKGSLYLRRNDKEFVKNEHGIPLGADIRDWPTLEKVTSVERLVGKLSLYYHRVNRTIHLKSLTWLYDMMFYMIYRKKMMSRGVEFISTYDKIYTTRLHGMVLAGFLEKETYYIDNSYGKISSLYNTWLNDVDNICSL